VVKYGGVAALKDTAYEKKIKQMTIELREKSIKDLRGWGYEVIPSETNFFMVDVGKDVAAVAEDFKKRKVLVGRKFPPMNNWLRCRSAPNGDDQVHGRVQGVVSRQAGLRRLEGSEGSGSLTQEHRKEIGMRSASGQE